MVSPQEVPIIAGYCRENKKDIVELFCQTALLGEPIEQAFPAWRFLADAFITYYTDYEPQSLLVALNPANGALMGYLAGCKDASTYHRVFRWQILPGLMTSLWRYRVLSHSSNRLFLARGLRSLVRGEFRIPKENELLQDYPAHLHVNVNAKWRHLGVGRKLIEGFFTQLKQEKVLGIHLRAYGKARSSVGFFAKLGFDKWSQTNVTMYQPYITDQITMVTMVKKL